MANVVYGEKGASLPGSSYQSYLTLSNFNTITLSDDSENPAATGKPGPANNPGDLSFGSDRIYYNNVVGTIDSGSINEGIYDNRQDGINALFEYILDYSFISPHTLGLSQTVEQWVNVFDSNGPDSNYLPTTLSGEQFTAAISNDFQLDQIANAIIQGEGASNPVAIEWDAASGVIINLISASNANIIDNDTLFAQDSTELDLDANTSTISSILGLIPGDMSVMAKTNLENGQFIISQGTANNLTEIASSIYDVGITLGSIVVAQFTNLGDGTTIFAGSSNTELVVGANGTLYFNDPYNDGIALPQGFVTNPGLGTLTGAMGNADLVILNADNASYTATIANQVVIAAGNADTLLAGANKHNDLVIDFRTHKVGKSSVTHLFQTNQLRL